MSLVTIISELWRFFVDHIKQLIIWGIVTGLILVGAQFALGLFNNPEDAAAYDYLSEVYQQEPAEFQAVITLDDGNVFHNSYIFDEYFTTPEILEEVEAQTGVEMTKFYESEQLLELFKTSMYRGGVAGIRNTSSGVITFRFLVAPTAEENLRVAEAYRDILLDEENIPFMEKQTTTIMVEPVIGEMLDLERTPEVPTEETLNIYAGQGVLSYVVFGVAGFILGAILSVAYFFIKRLLSDDIYYAFDYSWNFDDYHKLINSERVENLSYSELIKSVSSQNVIISQDGLSNVETQSSLAQANLPVDAVSEITIVVESQKTTKDWYREQYQFAKHYGVPVQIIHVY
ncbi:hypothetical protein HZY88_08260 [Aerococcaceae bacterium DSM 111176]|nr:hypothetical protein [Aerococcaceae bacterium DSM 111176]